MKPSVYVCLSAFLLLLGVVLIRTAHSSANRFLVPGDPAFISVSEHSPRVAAKASSDETRTRVLNSFGRLPMSFEVNRGQTDPRAKFLSRGQGYTLFLTRRGEAVLALHKSAAKRDQQQTGAVPVLEPDLETPMSSTVVRMNLVGGNAAPRVEGFEELPGKANYFIGNDPKKWRISVPLFAKVKYGNVYPGVDLVYYGNQKQLEHDFVVAPGVRPDSIKIGFNEAEKLTLDDEGNLVLALREGELRFQRPHIYQEVAGIRREVSGGYVLKNEHQVGFQVAAYDATRPLVIDPTLFYSTYLGGTNTDVALSIAADVAGNAYVTGYTCSTDYPTTPGAFQTSNASASGGCFNAFVTKLNPTGSAPLVYSTYLGGSGEDVGQGIAVDAAGNAYVTGYTCSADFPTTPGAFQSTNAFGCAGGKPPTAGFPFQAFVTKLNAAGSGLSYSTYLGGSGVNIGQSIAVDAAGDAYVTGYTCSTDFPITTGAFQTTNASFGCTPKSKSQGYNAFVTKLNPTGSAPLIYSTYLGGTTSDQGLGITVDASGGAYVTGCAASTNFPTTLGAFQTIYAKPNGGCGGLPSKSGGSNAFVTKLNATGSGLSYSTYLGGSGNDAGEGIAVDSAGDAYVTGYTSSSDFPTTTGAFQTTYGGNYDAFVTKLNPAGSAPVYSTYLGGTSTDFGQGIAVDLIGDAFVTGYTYSADFPTTTGAVQTANAGGYDAFATALNPLGTAPLIYSTYLGGSNDDFGFGAAVDEFGDAYVTGYTCSINFPTTSGAFQTTNASGGCTDAFVTKIANVTMPQGATTGKVTGGGKVDVNGGFANFGFIVQRQTANGSIHGDLQYHNHASGTKIHSMTFTTFFVTTSTAAFGGTCTNNGAPCTFNVNVQDNDQTGTADSFTISIDGGPPEGGTLSGGDIEIHNQ